MHDVVFVRRERYADRIGPYHDPVMAFLQRLAVVFEIIGHGK